MARKPAWLLGFRGFRGFPGFRANVGLLVSTGEAEVLSGFPVSGLPGVLA